MDKKLFQSYRSKEFIRISCVNQTYFVMSGGVFVNSVGNQPDNKTTKPPDNKTTNIFYPRNSWQCGFFMLTLRPNNYTL